MDLGAGIGGELGTVVSDVIAVTEMCNVGSGGESECVCGDVE